jgi:GDPmannose 4,6-dehydratase
MSVRNDGGHDSSSESQPEAALSPQQKVAFITRITGQDGSYLVELLLEKVGLLCLENISTTRDVDVNRALLFQGYVVHGLLRRSSSFNTSRIEHVYADRHDTNTRFFLHYGDLTDSTNLTQLIARIRPKEIYNLGAMSHVKVSRPCLETFVPGPRLRW